VVASVVEVVLLFPLLAGAHVASMHLL